MSELRVRIHLRDGTTRQVVREVPERPKAGGGSEQEAAKWRANVAATLIEEIAHQGTWIEERWFIPAHAIDIVEFVSGPIPAKAIGERDDDYYNPKNWASSRA